MTTWVEHTQQIGVRGILTGRTRGQGPLQSAEVQVGPGDNRWIPKRFLREVDQQGQDEDPQLRDLLKGRFGGGDMLRRVMTFEKLRGTLSEVLYSMDAAQIDFYPYQFKPVLRFIESPADRLILADEVGLGKTIEAALVWLELRSRRQAQRLLVICPRMLADKWKRELRHRFQIEADIVDAAGLDERNQLLEREGGHRAFALIATYTGLRPPRREAFKLDTEDEEQLREMGPKARMLRRLRQWSHRFNPFDLVVFDEAQAMRNPQTTTFKLGESLSMNAGAVLCVSATPLSTRNEDLRTLLRLIDPDFFSNSEVFESMLRENRPAVRAANLLASQRFDPNAVLEALQDLRQSSFIGQSALLQEAIECVSALPDGNRTELSRAQGLVEKLNILGTYVTRTRRVQVEEMRAIRDPRIIPVLYCPEEMRLYKAILAFVREQAGLKGKDFHIFEVIGWQLRAASCLPVVASKIRELGTGTDDELYEEVFGEGYLSEGGEVPAEVAYLPQCQALANFDFEANDSKFAVFIRLITSELAAEKCVVFSYYRGTLSYLSRRLAAQGIGHVVIHGGIPQEDRTKALEDFANDLGVRVLLSSEVGSEGIDLQFCSVVINYDLPWNPMRVEQRIGRIDRVGQKAPRLRIVHFKIQGTIEERLYVRLHMRLELFRNSLGDLDAVLGAEIEQLTRDLFSANLTPEMEEARIEQTARVIEHRHQELAELESRGEGLVGMADYLQHKVRESRGLGRFITPEELEESVREFFPRAYRGTQLRWDDPAPGCFRLIPSQEAQRDLATFLANDTSPPALRLRQANVALCFRAEVLKELGTRERNAVLYINHLSPLIRWITQCNNANAASLPRTFAMELEHDRWAPGLWFFGIRRWTFSGALRSQKLAYVAVDPNREPVSGNDAELMLSTVLRVGRSWAYPPIEPEILRNAYDIANECLDAEMARAFEQFSIENAHYLHVRTTRTEAHFRRLIDSAEQALATARDRGLDTRRFEGRVKAEKTRRKERLEELRRGTEASPEETDVGIGIIHVISLP